MNPIVLGIDVGTTGTKTVAFSADGTVVGQSYRSYPVHTPDVNRSEQDAEDLWGAVRETVLEATRDDSHRAAVVGLSLSTQGGTLIPLNKEFKPTRRAIVWMDHRAGEEGKFLCDTLGDDHMYRTCGWGQGSGLPAAEILWMKKHEPENYAKTAFFYTVPDYISHRLTGKAMVDMSNAGINMYCNITTGEYAEDIMDTVGIRREQLAEICKSGTLIGTLTAAAAAELCLPESVKVFAGGHDQYCVALGTGAIQDGEMFIASGTCWVITGVNDSAQFRDDGKLAISRHTVDGLWGSICSLQTGGACLEWMRQNFGMTDPDGEPLPFREIDRMASQRKAAEVGLFFMPFLAGVNYPVPNPKSCACFIGMDLSHDRYDLARAVMEGVTFQIRWMLDLFNTDWSAPIRLLGGAGKSALWSQILANVLGRTVLVPELADAACTGAAILAGVGCGVFNDYAEGCRRFNSSMKRFEPDGKRAMYNAAFEQYKRYCGGIFSLGENK